MQCGGHCRHGDVQERRRLGDVECRAKAVEHSIDEKSRWGSGGGDGDTIMIALDRTNRKVYFGVNGTWSNGPNEYFNIIKEDAYSFLFDVLYPFQLGDANNDGLINLFDVSHLISVIIYENDYSIDPYYYDLNFDSEINIFDLIFLADNILEL